MLDLHVSYGFSLLEVSTWGQLFYASEVERVEEDQHFIHLYSFLRHVQIYLLHASRLFRSFGYDGVLSARAKLTGLRGVRFRYERMPEYRQVVSRFDDELDVSIDISATELIEDPLAAARKLYRLIFFAVNWPEATADEASIQRLVEMGNEYNGFGR